MTQNTSHAVMAQRTEDKDSLDDFPTPPWATRALRKALIVTPLYNTQKLHVLEPACGRGHMARALGESFRQVTAFDIVDYGYKRALKPRDFRTSNLSRSKFDWVTTNPPFNQAEEFIDLSLYLASEGVAMFVRSTFTESIGRYNRLFSLRPPTVVAQFSERVVLHKGKLSPKGSTATAYCWLIWDVRRPACHGSTRYFWIPPCRAQLEKASDYR